MVCTECGRDLVRWHEAVVVRIDQGGIRQRPLLDQAAVIRVRTSQGPNAETKFETRCRECAGKFGEPLPSLLA